VATVVLEHLHKRYDNGAEAIQDLSLAIEDGEFLVLVGPSGCGKSTALRMIAGLETITSGTLTIGDRVVNDIHPKDRDIAFVFQNYALYPHMTVRQNIGFALKLRRMPKDEIERRVADAARLLELTSYLDRKPGQLSGGQRQRVAMGRAIVRRPQVFLMDEPLSNLDAKLRVQMRAEISRLQHDLGVTTIYVTHDQTEAMTMGDRVAVLSDGRLQQIDTPQRLYDAPENLFVATFIGSPQMNLVLGRVHVDDGGASVQVGDHRLEVPDGRLRESPALRSFDGREVIVGIRPEILEDATLDGGGASGRALPVRVLLREGLGSEVVVHAQLDAPAPRVETAQGENTLLTESSGVGIIARLDPRTQVALDEPAVFSVAVDRLHFFDPDSGLAIRS
jgi:multiple sugar transport system ATP-binding protein